MRKITRSDVALAFQRINATDEGQTVLAYLVAKYGYTRRSTFTEKNPTFAEGQRSVVIDIGCLIEADPNQLQDLEELDNEYGSN